MATGIDRGKPILEPVKRTGTNDVSPVDVISQDNLLSSNDAESDYVSSNLDDDDSVFGEGKKPRNAAAEEIRRLRAGGMDPLDIPAFLRKQAD